MGQSDGTDRPFTCAPETRSDGPSASQPVAAGEGDPVWAGVRAAAEEVVASEPLLASVLHATVLAHRTLEDALSFHLSSKLSGGIMSAVLVRDIVAEAFHDDRAIGAALRADLVAFRERDPASLNYLVPLMYYKGYHALESHRVAHWLWRRGRKHLAISFQNRVSEVFAVDIHPAAVVGKGVFVDHGTGIVVGETAVVDDNVSMLHEVTLGGTGRDRGDRHPKVHSGVLIGVGAKLLGNIHIGENAKVGAGSVVLSDVPPSVTVAGVPARIVSRDNEELPALRMDHALPPDDSG